MRFPKPSFRDLVQNYWTDRESVHDCPYIYRKHPININTCAIRMAEALVIANGLVESREAIAALSKRYSNGRGFLMGKYGYLANLCPHGIARGAGDLGNFLRTQWGPPTLCFTKQDGPLATPEEMRGRTGLVTFLKLPNYVGQGHIDLWNDTDAVGAAHWDAQRSFFWALD
jgi:hypothetical protein